MRLESRLNPTFLTLSENRISCVPTMIDDSRQWQEDREGVEKRMASVLSSLNLSWLLYIYAFMSSVHDCRSCVRLCTSFGGVEFWSWLSSAKSRWLTEWTGYDVWMWSSVQIKQQRSQHWTLWNTKHDWRRRGSRIVDNNALIPVQKVRSKLLESCRGGCQRQFRDGKEVLLLLFSYVAKF